MDQNVSSGRNWLHVAVFFLITFGVGFLPPVGITAMGMKILGVFLGLLYGWPFIGFTWPSMICLVALGFTGYGGSPGKVISGALGHPMVLFTLIVMAFTVYCSNSGFSEAVAKWLLSRRFFAGRPWVFTASVLISTLIIGFLVDGVPAVFLIAGIMYTVFHDVGFKKGDDYPAYLLAGIYIAGVLTFGCKPWMGQNLLGIAALAEASGGAAVIDYFSVIAVAMPVCIATLLVYTLIVRFVFRPDVSHLQKLTPEYLAEISRDIRFGQEQKIAAVALAVFLLLLFLPNVLSKEGRLFAIFGKFDMVAAITIVVGVLSIIRVKGKPVLDFQTCSSGINWNVAWMLAASIPVSAALSSPEAGMSQLLTEVMGGFAGQGNIILFLIGFMIFLNVATQFTHNVTITLIAVPLVWNLSQTIGFNPIGVSILVFLAAGAAFATPAASTVGALSFANAEWVGIRRAFAAGILGCVGGILCMVVLGLPLTMALVGI